MFSLRASYRKTRNLRIRPIPEMGLCLVFTPAAPQLYTLNPAAWLVLELCDGRTGRSLEREYARAITESSRASTPTAEDVRGIVQDMERKGIIERHQGGAGRTGA